MTPNLAKLSPCLFCAKKMQAIRVLSSFSQSLSRLWLRTSFKQKLYSVQRWQTVVGSREINREHRALDFPSLTDQITRF